MQNPTQTAPDAPRLNPHQATPEMIQEVRESDRRKQISFTDAGAKVVDVKPERFEKLVEVKAREMVGEINLTAAQERLQRLRGGRGVQFPIKKHEILGETWFTQKANFERINQIAMLTPRGKKGVLDMGATGSLSALLSAMLFTCCVASETDSTPFFEKWADAFSFVEDSDEAAVETCNALFSAILLQSPDIWPEGQKALVALQKENDLAAPLVSNPSPLPSERQSSGSPETESTNLPQT